MAAIGNGDWVQCIRSEAHPGAAIVKGNTYYCEATGGSHDACEYCGHSDKLLVLMGATPRGWGWCVCGFKPLGGNAKTLTAPPQRITEAA